MNELQKEIIQLKEEKNAIILEIGTSLSSAE